MTKIKSIIRKIYKRYLLFKYCGENLIIGRKLDDNFGECNY